MKKKRINNIGCKVYNGILYPKKSISGNFAIIYRPNIGMSIWTADDELVTYYYKQGIKEYEKAILDDESKEKVLTRIQMKKY